MLTEQRGALKGAFNSEETMWVQFLGGSPARQRRAATCASSCLTYERKLQFLLPSSELFHRPGEISSFIHSTVIA